MIIEFAGPADENRLKEIFTAAEMDMAGEAEEHVVLRKGGGVVAGGRLYQAEEDLFHLLVFAVAAEERGRGTGRRLLAALAARPWEYCLEAVRPEGPYRVTTMAKGTAAAFYQRAGFTVCDAAALPAPFGEQCRDCPDREACGPVPLEFTGQPANGTEEGAGWCNISR
jgi:N-acetylglutamate synthase-like GNAT family acetyltransferase